MKSAKTNPVPTKLSDRLNQVPTEKSDVWAVFMVKIDIQVKIVKGSAIISSKSFSMVCQIMVINPKMG